MIPLADEIPRRRAPAVTVVLLVLNVAVFLYELALGADAQGLLMSLGAVPAAITSPAEHPMAFLTLFTSTFLHGGWTHLIGNMLYLWIFGDNVEDALGHLGYLVFYLFAGVGAGLTQVAMAPSSLVPAIGASGAIAGVLAVYLVLYPSAPVRALVPGFFFARVVRVPAVAVLGLWFVLQLFNGFLSLGVSTMATGGVAWFAHIGGFVVGLVVGVIARVRRRASPHPGRARYW